MKNKVYLPSLIFLIFICTSFSLFGQDVKKQYERFEQNETEDDPYLPNEFNNEKVSPAYIYRSSATEQTLNSYVFTTQVNINNAGQNIIGDAANEPNIAISPVDAGVMVIGWRQFDNITSNFRQAGYAYTTDTGTTWTFPGVINPGVFRSDPVLDYDSNGKIYYNSLTSSAGLYTCKVFESVNGGINWNSGTDAYGGDKQWMVIDRGQSSTNGNIYSYWTASFSSCPPDNFTRSTNAGVLYDNCTLAAGNPYWATMAINNSGELFIGSGSNNTDSLLVIKSSNAQVPGSIITWDSAMVFMDGSVMYQASVNPVGIMGQVNIDIDISSGPGEGNIYILASLQRSSIFDQGDVMFSRCTDNGLTWSQPLRINDDPSSDATQWMAVMSVAPNGRIDAAWLDTRNNLSNDNSALYYSYSTDQGNTWSLNEMISPVFDPHIGYPNQDKMGDYFDMISDNTGAHLAWVNTNSSGQDVYYSHIIPPIPVSINETATQQNVSVYPNPSDGVFNITNENKFFTLEVYFVIGTKIYTSTCTGNKIQVNITPQPSGIYFLKIINRDGSSIVKRVTKNH